MPANVAASGGPAPPQRILLLLSCSNVKSSGGEQLDAALPRMADSLPRLACDFLSKRRLFRGLLRGGPPRLYNILLGFRDDRPCNGALAHGPDFGEPDTRGEIYLPAWRRYSGRFSGRLAKVSPGFWHTVPNDVEILFVSGLCGLLRWNEPIQNYDCHFGDYTDDQAARSVGQLWGSMLTDALCDFLRHEATTPGLGAIADIYDLLSELDYQHLFKWQRVAGCGVRVHHRVSKERAGPDILPCLAEFVASELDRCRAGQLQSDHWYAVGVDEVVHLGFERELGQFRGAKREGGMDEAEEALRKGHPTLSSAPPGPLRRLVLAEHSWRKVKRLGMFDYGAVIVSYAKAVEDYLRVLAPGFTGHGCLGDFAHNLQGEPGWQRLVPDIRDLSISRNAGAHPSGKTGPDEVEVVRERAIRIMVQGEALRTKH